MSFFGGKFEEVIRNLIDTQALYSIQKARILDAVSEGEIVGLVNGAQSIYLNGIPVQNPDGSLNFTGVTWDQRFGTLSQTYMQGFPDVETEVGVNIKVLTTSAVEQHITDQNTTSIRVTVNTPRLIWVNDNGDKISREILYAIDIQPYLSTTGGPVPQGYVTVLNDRIYGRTTTKYQRSFIFNVEATGVVQWDVRIRRLTPDNTDTQIADDLYFDSYTIIKDIKMMYPYTGYIGLQLDAQQFSQTPARAYDMYLLRVQVPTNYFPATRAYTRNVITGADMGVPQTWDGNFYVAWTDNPAWCWYDMVVSNRYGLGTYVNVAEVDKWALFTIAQYCDVLVSDGKGGMEPRFTCNLYLQSAAEAYRVLLDMASIFRGMVYWGAGSLTVVQDASTLPTYQFTNANVIDGLFTYQGSARSARHTVALVAWNDANQQFKQVIEYVSDEDAIVSLGYRPTNVVALGCKSQGQARRYGRAILLSEQTETETVTFKTGVEGNVLAPGIVIKILDNNRVGLRFGGRVTGFNSVAKTLTVDAIGALTPATNYTLSVILSDGTLGIQTITSANVAGKVISLGTWFPVDPGSNSVWSVHLTTAVNEAKLFRVIAITEIDKIQQEVTALAYNDAKYAAIESNNTLDDAPTFISHLPDAVSVTPTNLVLDDHIRVQADGTIESVLTIGFASADVHAQYRLQYRKDGGAWTDTPTFYTTYAEIHGVADGSLYEVNVFSKNAFGSESALPLSGSRTIVGKLAPPEDVADFSFETNKLHWQLVTDDDVRAGGGYLIRFLPGQASADQWPQAIPVHNGVITDNPYTLPISPSGIVTFLIKAVDSSANESINPTLLVTSFDNLVIENEISRVDHRVLNWPGLLTNGSIVTSELHANGVTPFWSTNGAQNMWSTNGVNTLMWGLSLFSEMRYQFSFTATSDLVGARMSISSLITGEPWSIEYRENSSDDMWVVGTDPQSMWGYDISKMVGTYLPALAGLSWGFRHGDDIPSYMPYLLSGSDLMWAPAPDWRPWPGEVTAAFTSYDFRITTGFGPVQGIVSQLVLILDVPDIEETVNDVVVASLGTRLALTKVFRAIKAVTFGLKQDGISTAVTARWLDKDVALGPLVKCFDNSNAATSGTVDARVVGY